MSNLLTPQETARWQQRLAAQASNRARTLADPPQRTAAEDEEKLQAAHAACHREHHRLVQVAIAALDDQEERDLLGTSMRGAPVPRRNWPTRVRQPWRMPQSSLQVGREPVLRRLPGNGDLPLASCSCHLVTGPP